MPIRIGLGLMLALAAFCQAQDLHKLLEEGDRLAWIKAWTRAEPIYAQAERIFSDRGDRRNTVYTAINRLRGALPRLPVPEVSERYAEYLEDPIVKSDNRIRLRCLILKGETDEDLDPALAEQSWQEAFDLAKKLGDSLWENRARGELGVVAGIQGDFSSAVMNIGSALLAARRNGDGPSQVRWLSIIGHGQMQFGRYDEALRFYDEAIQVAGTIAEFGFPLMAYVGKGDALTKLGRFEDAEQLLHQALTVAAGHQALGYQAELKLKLAVIAREQKDSQRALSLLHAAADLARQAGGNRILAEIDLERARLERSMGRTKNAEGTLSEGVRVARAMRDRLLLPKLLAQLAEIRSAQGRRPEARGLLEEAADLMEVLLAKLSSPTPKSQLIAQMDELFLTRLRLESAGGPDPGRMFTVIEQARGRVLADALLARPLAELRKSPEQRAGEREIAALQMKLDRARNRSERRRIMDQIFGAEARLTPVSTEHFTRARSLSPRTPVLIAELQRVLREDELFLEYALADPASYCIAVTRNHNTARVLPARSTIRVLSVRVRDGWRAA